MRIAIVTPVFPPYRGGMGQVAFEQAKSLAASSNDVTVFTPDWGENLSASGYKLELLWPFLKFGNAAILPQLLWKLRNFDRVIFHYPFFGSAELLLWGAVAKEKLRIFYHMDVVGRGWLALFFKFHRRFILLKIMARAGKIFVTTFDYVASGHLADLFKKETNKFVEAPLTVNKEKFKKREKDPRLLARLNISPENKIILFVGGLDSAHYFKGLDVLLNAFKEFLNPKRYTLNAERYVLLIVGSGNLRSSYETLAKELGISDNVIFAGSPSDDELPLFYNLADLFVFPSIDRSEAFGLALLEALTSGVPAIASALPGVRTLIKEGENGFLVPSGNYLALAQKMFDFFGNKFL